MSGSTSGSLRDAEADVEANVVNGHGFLDNDTVQSFAWRGVTVNVKDRATKQEKSILLNTSGHVQQGELMVLMGPSGSGKTTLLNVLAHRNTGGASVDGDILVNGQKVSTETFRQLTSYVEQEDVLVGSLTVEETLHFAAQLSLPSTISKKERLRRIADLLDAFGIQGQAKNLIGTPIRKGISGGQKRRVSVASQLITSPKILFLDEPTSGLDSTASFEVMSFVKQLAMKHKLIVISSIHQPSAALTKTFDKLLILSAGKTCYFGPGQQMKDYFDRNEHPMPTQTNPAEFVLDLVSTDFAVDSEEADARLSTIHKEWEDSPEVKAVDDEIERLLTNPEKYGSLKVEGHRRVGFVSTVLSLLHQSLIKSYRDAIAYGVRIAMYLALAIMMGTVWLRLSSSQENIQPFINALFFGSAFMSFMAVAYVPSFLEDRSIFIKDRANGLYGAFPFLVANFIIGLPYLFLITILFSVVAYWLVNFRAGADAFFTFVMWVFLDLVAAESLVVLMSSLFPNFVIALALTAFANGLWMCVGGFMVSPTILNVFWKYVFHYIDYQTYVFQGMMVNEFAERPFDCGPGCHCMYPSELSSECKIAGTAVLHEYGYATGRRGKWVGILIGIIAVYRLFCWIALVIRKR